jgi:dienelactone hydrolase
LLTRSTELDGAQLIRVEVPFGETSLPAYFVPAHRPDGSPAPCVIQWNGLDSTKEMMYYSGFGDELARRGIATLMVDTPGSGEALRLRGLRAQPDTEVWAAACIDHLETRDDVDASRIGLVGWSLGGYYAPRAAAFEKRVKLVVAWGANHNWGEVQHGRLRREGENPVPHYWEHVMWVWGCSDLDSFLRLADQVTLDGVVEQITVPFLITHGANDRQISVDYAHRSFEQATASPKPELRIFTEDEGGTEHISIDNLPVVGAFIADWIAETFDQLPFDESGRT